MKKSKIEEVSINTSYSQLGIGPTRINGSIRIDKKHPVIVLEYKNVFEILMGEHYVKMLEAGDFKRIVFDSKKFKKVAKGKKK